MIVNINGPNDSVSVFGSQLVIESFNFDGKVVPATTIDFTPYQGQTMRVYLNDDGTISVYPNTSHYWLLVEVNLPPQQFNYIDTGQVDELGSPILQREPIPLDLSALEVKVWALPEVA
ncbi:MAG: hypothetical protein ACM309_00665 [Bacillota bacterium]